MNIKIVGKKRNSVTKTIVFTTIALIAFAANSVLCRLALGDGKIDASSFTIIRLLSGIIILVLLTKLFSIKEVHSEKGNWLASIVLFLYAVTFSFAYISLDTATGALILFGSVQITMIVISILSGTRLHIPEWTGLLMAFMGFIYLILPGVSAPSPTGLVLMTLSGVAWGLYTLMGRNSKNPILNTSRNFLRTIPLLVALGIATISQMQTTTEGILLAVLSGAFASGIGYTIWYMALGGLSSTQAAVLQLLVPLIAAAGGVIFVSEQVTFRLLISAAIIITGILLVILGKIYFNPSVAANNTASSDADTHSN